MQYVIVGASGFVGSYLCRALKQEGEPVLALGRHPDGSASYLPFDVQRDDIREALAQARGDVAAVLCFARPRIDDCRQNYDDAYDINVARTKEILQALLERGAQAICFSSDQVFDGKRGNYTEESEPCPLNAYGAMKAELEEYVLRQAPDACVFRLPKVVGTYPDPKNVFAEWAHWRDKGEVACIRGNRISFVCVEDIHAACKIAFQKKLHGLYNVAGNRAYTRAELARRFFGLAGEREADVREYGLEHFRFREPRPLDTSLANGKFRAAGQFRFADMDDVIREFLKNSAQRKPS